MGEQKRKREPGRESEEDGKIEDNNGDPEQRQGHGDLCATHPLEEKGVAMSNGETGIAHLLSDGAFRATQRRLKRARKSLSREQSALDAIYIEVS